MRLLYDKILLMTKKVDIDRCKIMIMKRKKQLKRQNIWSAGGFEANESYRYNSYVFMCNCTKVESSLLQIDPAHRYVELFPDILKKNQNKKFNN